jgi:hypothetical protein
MPQPINADPKTAPAKKIKKAGTIIPRMGQSIEPLNITALPCCYKLATPINAAHLWKLVFSATRKRWKDWRKAVAEINGDTCAVSLSITTGKNTRPALVHSLASPSAIGTAGETIQRSGVSNSETGLRSISQIHAAGCFALPSPRYIRRTDLARPAWHVKTASRIGASLIGAHVISLSPSMYHET